MRRKLISLGLGAAACLALTAPAASSAAMPDVNHHLKKADQALAKAGLLVTQGSDAQAALQVAKSNLQSQLADDEAGGLRGLRKVVLQWDQNVNELIALLEQFAGPFQDELATQIEIALQSRERVLAALTALVEKLPPEVAGPVSELIASISSGVFDDLDTLMAAIDSGHVVDTAMVVVLRAIETAQDAVTHALNRLEGLVGQLPPQASQHIEQILGGLAPQLDGLFDQLGDLLGGLGLPPGLVPPGLQLPPGFPFGPGH